MRSRNLVLLSLFLLVLFGIGYINPVRETYLGMGVQEVGGKPYLVLQELDTFSVYAPVGDTELQGWKPVFDSRLGLLYGVFEMPKSTPESKPGLGVFFDTRFAVLDVAAEGKDNAPALPMTLDFKPETAAELNGKLYCFGAKLRDDPEAVSSAEFADGELKAARLDGANFVEVPGAALKDFRFGKSGVALANKGFWLHAIPFNGKLAVIWRPVEFKQALVRNVVGLREAAEGDMWMALFDGTKFSAPVAIKNLPAGNSCEWVANGQLQILIQTRANKQNTGTVNTQPAHVEIWTVAEDGTATMRESIDSGKKRLGLISFIAAERFSYAGREHILRSTWQRFEVLRKGDDGSWTTIPSGASGLPVFALEHWLYIGLGICAATVFFGAWLAYKRRKHVVAVLEKIQPRELLAPLGLRASALALDWAVVLSVTVIAAKFDFDSFIDMLPSPLDLPFTPFMGGMLAYFAVSEWAFGTTPGKAAMGLCVIRDDAQKPGIWAVLVRNVTGLYERHPLYLMIAAPMLIFSPRRQRIGDLLSRTVVVQRQGLERVWAARAATGGVAGAPAADILGTDSEKDSKRRD